MEKMHNVGTKSAFMPILFWPLATSAFFIHHLKAGTILTQYQKVKDKIDTFEISITKLTFSVKIRDQIYSLS